MTFVPYVPPPPRPSPRAQELGRRLAECVGDFRRENPDMNSFEIRQAMNLATSGLGGRNVSVPVLVATLVLTVIFGLVALNFWSGAGSPVILIAVTGLVVVLLGVAVAIKSRQERP